MITREERLQRIVDRVDKAEARKDARSIMRWADVAWTIQGDDSTLGSYLCARAHALGYSLGNFKRGVQIETEKAQRLLQELRDLHQEEIFL